ncbi:hypothetical protein UFOVP687_20 [uncultured Caudovirales phage]|uniref:Uncharacterized protein n=1 Tax=uncultured Caudovirales phage TaxID=2100421 RepID=A0A6J5M7N6_9CAUD|nr:hypothetical protein UFOVP414_36 [uncultured Caudovirales phage]CAB4157691.1 hypothetical protein UFOVP687_20 [uncultured Caudovirales phage]
MPAAPLLVFGAQVTGAAAAVGASVATAVGLGTVSTAVATAIGSGVISAGITAASGGDAGDILKSAVVSGGAGYVGGMAGGAAKGALPASTSQAVSNTVSAAAAGGASSATGALAYGASPGEALEAGLKGAAVGGLTQAGVEGVKAGSAQGTQKAGEARLKVPQQGQYERGAPIAEVPSQTGITNRVPTGGGVGLVADPSLLYSSRFAPSQPMREREGGGVEPAYQRAETLITPESLSAYTEPYRETRDFNPPALTRRQERLLSEGLELGLSETLRDRSTPSQPTPTTVYLGGTGGEPTPGSQALAQALRVDSGTTLFGSDKEGRRRPVWNVESLKLKDEMGA